MLQALSSKVLSFPYIKSISRKGFIGLVWSERLLLLRKAAFQTAHVAWLFPTADWLELSLQKVKGRYPDPKCDFFKFSSLILINGWQQVIQGLDRPLTCKGRSTEAESGNMKSWQKFAATIAAIWGEQHKIGLPGSGPAFRDCHFHWHSCQIMINTFFSHSTGHCKQQTTKEV